MKTKFLLVALVIATNVMATTMPTDIKEYTQEGIVKDCSNDSLVPMTYLAYKKSSQHGYDCFNVFLTSPSGSNRFVTAIPFNDPMNLNYTLSDFWKNRYTDTGGYVYFDLQSIESGIWKLRRVQSNAGDWYYTKPKFNVNANAFNGSVTGEGTYYMDSTATLSAIPNEHYHFTQWSDGNTDNPREIVVTQDTTLTAAFAINQYTVSISSDNPSAGIVSGSGTYDALNNVTVMAAASAVGYKWDKWSDGVTLAGRQITLTSDTALTAYFVSADEVECIEVEENNALLGMADIQIIATPNNGAQFTQWSDGNTDNPRIVTNAPGLYTAIFSESATKTNSIQADQQNAIQKRIVDDQLIIQREGKSYNAQGGEL